MTKETDGEAAMRFARQYQARVIDAREMRNSFIRTAHKEGMTLRAIAEAVGLSPAGVAKIVAKGV